jgi:hypothetical protein
MQRNLLLITMVALMAVMSVSGAHAKSRTHSPSYAMWQTQDEWYVDSGRYINGRVPSYSQQRSQNLYVTVGAWHQERTIERHTSALVYSEGYYTLGREEMVRALGA